MNNRHVILTLLLAACDSGHPVSQETPKAPASEEVIGPQPIASLEVDPAFVNCACLDFEDNTYFDECFSPPKECSDEEVLQCAVE